MFEYKKEKKWATKSNEKAVGDQNLTSKATDVTMHRFHVLTMSHFHFFLPCSSYIYIFPMFNDAQCIWIGLRLWFGVNPSINVKLRQKFVKNGLQYRTIKQLYFNYWHDLMVFHLCEYAMGMNWNRYSLSALHQFHLFDFSIPLDICERLFRWREAELRFDAICQMRKSDSFWPIELVQFIVLRILNGPRL